MGGLVALELVQVTGLEPAQENLDGVKFNVKMNACHAGLLCLITCRYGSHDPLHSSNHHCANAQHFCDLFTLRENAFG